jgi:hypothetical protein
MRNDNVNGAQATKRRGGYLAGILSLLCWITLALLKRILDDTGFRIGFVFYLRR